MGVPELDAPTTARSTRLRRLTAFCFVAVCLSFYLPVFLLDAFDEDDQHTVPIHAQQTLDKCRNLHTKPGPPPDFNLRTESDRFVPGTKATLLRNATIWTGRVDGLEIIKGDLLLDKGSIKGLGVVDAGVLAQYSAADLNTIDAEGAWVSPGIVDMHSHLGVDSAPELLGGDDTNSIKGLVLPWLRSIDGLNTHDDAYKLSISGGLTTAVVLPGSADAIGGQAFVIKLRPTDERSPSSMLLEPPFGLNGSDVDSSLPPRWRQMKHACGENPSRVYGGTRMDTIWAFRQGYETARKIKQSQDQYCDKATAGQWNGIGEFPEDLQWEALVDVLRGRVKVHNHCYEAVDLDGMVRITNEFKFHIAAFHHAHETYLVPDLLKKMYGGPPAVALFATNARYKREAYRGSEFAPSILADNDINVVMKSDHPVLNSRHLLYEAQQAHYYGLPAEIALRAVTTTPAFIMGQDHRIGTVREGYDADIVLWDSHPLALGAAPQQVWIDGIPQLDSPNVVKKPEAFQRVPKTPDFEKEKAAAIKYEGLPPLVPKKTSSTVVFTNVSSVFLREDNRIMQAMLPSADVNVVVKDGKLMCYACDVQESSTDAEYVNLQGGSVAPALISYGSPLGLEHIAAEASTSDGAVGDHLTAKQPAMLGGNGALIRAVDGLQYSTRDALIANRAGVTTGVVAPTSYGFLSGLSCAFSTGAAHKLEGGSVVKPITALHVSVSMSSSTSVSTQISALRKLLLGGGEGELGMAFRDVVDGVLPLIIDVSSADVMATLILLKAEVEQARNVKLQVTFAGATEAHLLAKEIGEAQIGVILNPSRPFPGTWESRRILPGPPISHYNAPGLLLENNVTVGIGIQEPWSARNTRFDVAWAALEMFGEISKADALALASTNLEKLLGLPSEDGDLVVTSGGDLLSMESKVAGIVSPRRGIVELMD
ncbi:hypothetical protein BD626DRAFT_422385 [Schizophyllum amplum]|uniref:Amidohydrolase-related domain-containing protein n=1 Tax=Schizophyllum amplum TaxID=97359 RepID=A0A550CYM4_9AGAR|nr:hypothetical protein BD626DRAFT_422385 [Auriculariopsis ampla]